MTIVYRRWIFTILLAAMSPISEAREKLVFTCSWPPQSPIYNELFFLYDKAFGALNIDFNFSYTAASQSILDAHSGASDGVCARVRNFAEISKTPYLVRVDAAVVSVNMQLWSNNADVTIDSMVKQSGGNLRIGYERGHKWSHDFLLNEKANHAISTPNIMMGVKMLAAKQLDMFIMSDINARFVLDSNPDLRDVIHMAGDLGTLKFYPFLHRKHQGLAISLATELKRLLD